MSRFGSDPIPGMPEPMPPAGAAASAPDAPVVQAAQDAQPQQPTREQRVGGLRVVNGPWAGDVIDLPEEAGEIMLGRNDPPSVSVDIDLAEAELGKPPMVSRRHAILRRAENGEVTVEDLGSTNGTWVGGARLRSGEPSITLEPGAALRLANIDMVAVGVDAC